MRSATAKLATRDALVLFQQQLLSLFPLISGRSVTKRLVAAWYLFLLNMNVVFSSSHTVVAVWLLLHISSQNGWFSARQSVFHDVWRLLYLLERQFSQIATLNCAHNKKKRLRALKSADVLWMRKHCGFPWWYLTAGQCRILRLMRCIMLLQ